MERFKTWLLTEEAKTPKHAVKVHVKDTRQVTNYTCGVSALEAVLDFYHIKVSEMRLAKLAKSDPDKGTATQELIKTARSFGLETKVMHNMDISDLTEWLDQDKPVIVLVQAWGDKEDYDDLEDGHYIVAVGYTEDTLYFMDPSHKKGTRGKIPKKEFLKRWKDVDTNGKDRWRWGCAVWKNGETNPKVHRKVKKIP